MSEPEATTPSDPLVAELASLHRGRGLRRSRIAPAVGPELRAVLGLTSDADERAVRARLVDAIVGGTRTLDTDLQVSFLHASALKNDKRLLQDRLKDAGDEIERDTRTVRRRLDDANSIVARHLRAEHERRNAHPHAPSGWVVRAMGSEVDLRSDPESVVADKTILAIDPLTELTESVYFGGSDAQNPEPQIQIEVLSGGTLSGVDRITPNIWRYRVGLAKRLAPGDTHRFLVRILTSGSEHLPPYNALAPMRPCTEFICSARFPSDRVPRRIQRIDGLPTSVFNDPVDDSSPFPPDEFVRTIFRNLEPGLAYGLRWSSD